VPSLLLTITQRTSVQSTPIRSFMQSNTIHSSCEPRSKAIEPRQCPIHTLNPLSVAMRFLSLKCWSIDARSIVIVPRVPPEQACSRSRRTGRQERGLAGVARALNQLSSSRYCTRAHVRQSRTRRDRWKSQQKPLLPGAFSCTSLKRPAHPPDRSSSLTLPSLRVLPASLFVCVCPLLSFD